MTGNVTRQLQEATASVTKDTNPKDAVGTRKPPRSTASQAVAAEVGVAMLEGALKYGRHNYRVAGVRGSVYYDATRRHLDDWWEGNDIDPDSGLHELTKAIAALTVLRDAMIQDLWVDDRPPKTPKDHRAYLQRMTDALLDRYPDPVPAYLEGDRELHKEERLLR